jgi:hypothetical protein
MARDRLRYGRRALCVWQWRRRAVAFLSRRVWRREYFHADADSDADDRSAYVHARKNGNAVTDAYAVAHTDAHAYGVAYS